MLPLYMSLRRLRLGFVLSSLRAALANSVMPQLRGSLKKISTYVYLQDFYRRLTTFAYKTLRNSVSEGDLIKYTLNFEFR